MTGLKAFFSYFGSKVGAAAKYPAPRHDLIIEPFAGAAGYSILHHEKEIQLFDASPTICGIWRFLIRATPADILSLPLLTADVRGLSQAERDFIGFWWVRSGASPVGKPVPWMESGLYPYSFWSEKTRGRIARQVNAIKHWKIGCHPYNLLPPCKATWFIDPPYQKEGARYPHGSRRMDYAHLAEWVRARPGQVIACESAPAAYLPFVPLFQNSTIKYRKVGCFVQEMIYTGETE